MVRLQDGYALITSDRWADDWQGLEPTVVPRQVQVGLGEPVSYGDLDGDGRDEAAIALWCANGGGTAGGQLEQGIAVMTPGGKAPSLFGIIATVTPAPDVHAPYFDNSKTEIEDPAIKVEEVWYGPTDGTCCPTGRTVSTWRLDGTRLERVESRVIATPTTRP
jgi:hypothetical protein